MSNIEKSRLVIRPLKSDAEREERDRILQVQLRDPGAMAIIEDYPLVLDWKISGYSLGAFTKISTLNESRLLAHLNYFPRQLEDMAGRNCGQVAILANVATHKDHERKGIMQEFLRLMQSRASLEGYLGLILWSEHEQFYQKSGFQKLGSEYRFGFSVKALVENMVNSGLSERLDMVQVGETANMKFHSSDLEDLLKGRCPSTLTFKRSLDEYHKLLSIPNTIIAYNGHNFRNGYALMNRGSDMVATVHEWGVPDPTTLIILALKQAEYCGFSDFQILAPCHLDSHFVSAFLKISQTQKHDLCLFWDASHNKSNANFLENNNFFVWGMDSM